jgi:hypothetical protein
MFPRRQRLGFRFQPLGARDAFSGSARILVRMPTASGPAAEAGNGRRRLCGGGAERVRRLGRVLYFDR